MTFKSLWNAMLVSPVAFVVTLLVIKSAIANPFRTVPLILLATKPTDTQAASSPIPDNTKILEQINSYSRDPDTEDANNQVDGNAQIGQVNNVSQLQDVRPGDWAYQALQDLVERYGCIAGYPNSSYRGNRAMTRYEFAASLNACFRQFLRC